MERNPFTKQGKALSCDIREIIVEKWLEGSKPFEIAQRFNLPRKTVSNIVDRFVHTGSVKPGVGGNRLQTARMDDEHQFQVLFRNQLYLQTARKPIYL